MIEIMKASAGSGKTYSLARKYIALLLESEDRYAYRHILAVTFTNKATDEMKVRILKELHRMATDPAHSGYRSYFIPSLFPSEADLQKKAETVLHDILHDYSAFAVSTIDRFFQQTLKAFSREIGQFASYQVELDKDSLLAESVDRMLDSLTEDDGSLLPWLTDNVLEQIEQGERYSMDANLLEMAVRLGSPQKKEALAAAGFSEDHAFTKDKLLDIKKICREIMEHFRGEVREKAKASLDIMIEAGVDPADSTRGFLKALFRYAELGDNERVESPTESFMKNAADSEKWFAKSKAKTLLPKVYPFLEAPLEDFCRLFDKEFAVYNTACILEGQLYGLGVAGELDRTFRELMKEKNVLCIDDSNTLLRDIIDGSDAPFIYEKTGVRYDHYLLDEFQDTSRVQWQNFSPLLKESEAKGGSNLIVGDVKQSIYRWRGSDWKLLHESIPADFPEHSSTVLDTNYRSLSGIVEFNNSFFVEAAKVIDAMSGHGCNGPMSEIYADVRQNVCSKAAAVGNVSLTFCDKDQELAAVLAAVNETRDAGADLSEIAVLVRSNVIGEQVASYLIDNGIPVITDDSLRVKGSITVRRIVSLMSLAGNPENTVNGYLAESLDVAVPELCSSLTDMAEKLFRDIIRKDETGAWKGEILHIQSFMDCLQDYVASEGNSLRGFLEYWENENPSISSPSSGECVRIMTIHKSKGLAFPYVIVPFVENITLYKSSRYWCSPDLEGTPLGGVADGVYDVSLSKSSEMTLFSDDYKKERLLQQVDNMNTLYVAMTRPSLGMHLIARTPSGKALAAIDSNDTSLLTDFSQILYWFASGDASGMKRTEDESGLRFDLGEMPDFRALRRKEDSSAKDFIPGKDGGFPSIPLNKEDLDNEDNDGVRGRLRYSADSVDFFSDEGETGISASRRIKGVVLHDILARIIVAEDLEKAARISLDSGEISIEEYDEVIHLLKERIASAVKRGWFGNNASKVMNEMDIIDTDGEIYRPDRVEITDGKVLVIDYKFGEHYRKYERQLRHYSDMWRRMGYDDVSSVLWYVYDDKVMEVK